SRKCAKVSPTRLSHYFRSFKSESRLAHNAFDLDCEGDEQKSSDRCGIRSEILHRGSDPILLAAIAGHRYRGKARTDGNARAGRRAGASRNVSDRDRKFTTLPVRSGEARRRK